MPMNNPRYKIVAEVHQSFEKAVNELENRRMDEYSSKIGFFF